MTPVSERRRMAPRILLEQKPTDSIHPASAPQFKVNIRKENLLVISDQGYGYILAHDQAPDHGPPMQDLVDPLAKIAQFQAMSGGIPALASGTPPETDTAKEWLSDAEHFHATGTPYHGNSPIWLLTPLGADLPPGAHFIQIGTSNPLIMSVAEPHAPQSQDFSLSDSAFPRGDYQLLETIQQISSAAADSDAAADSEPATVPDTGWSRQTELWEFLVGKYPTLLQKKQPLAETLSLGRYQGKTDQIEQPANPLNIELQLNDLRNLKHGWAEGLQPASDWGNSYGRAPSSEGLDWLAHQFNKFYAESLPRPYLFPTPLGGVQAEWLCEPHDASLEIDLESHSAEWHCLNFDTKASTIQDLNLDKAESWEWLSTQILSLGPTAA